MQPTLKCWKFSRPSENRSNLKYTALAVAVLTLTACATHFTPEGAKVRAIDTTVAMQCRHIGMVNSFKSAFEGGAKAAQVDIRNRTAAAGGNSFVLLSFEADGSGGAEYVGEAYACQF